MVIIDSHCHLDMLPAAELAAIIKRAEEFEVKYLQTICTKLADFQHILAIAKQYPQVFASVGIHPSEVARSETDLTEQLLTLSQDNKVIGLGETGLDYFYNNETNQRQWQKEAFAAHIQAAQINKLPVIVHTRDAEADTIDILATLSKSQNFPGLIHCFTASKAFAKQALDLGLYISISGIVTFNKAQELQDIVRYLPLDRILIETDAPYLAPVPKRGKTNEPAYTRYVAEHIAKLKQLPLAHVAQQTSENFAALFTKALLKLK